jgi:hypothetical protein
MNIAAQAKVDKQNHCIRPSNGFFISQLVQASTRYALEEMMEGGINRLVP